MQPRILSQAAEEILSVERHWLSRLQVALAQFPATEEDRAVLDRSVRQLDDLFLLVIVGEFNSGKSALINALFGEALLEMGVTPTTTRVHLLRYGKTFERVAVDADVDVFSVPAAMLEEITIVDTPGTNAIYREHEAITRDFMPRADLVLFVTSVDRPFTESERAFLQLIREWGKKVVVVLNKIDILEDPGELDAIERFVKENVLALLGFAPEVLPVSARLALRAKQAQDAEGLAASRIEVLEAYIIDRLDEKERVRLKLLNPLGVGLHMTGKYLSVVDGRMALLKDDFAVMENITQQLGVYREDMAREFRLRLSDVDRQLQIFENRGVAFFDETMRLVHFFDLLDRPRLEAQFREQVISDIPEAIDERVEEITDWLVTRNQTQWQRVMEHIRRRKEVHADELLGEIPSTFEANRNELIESVGLVAQEALQTYDPEGEAYRIAQSLKNAVANTAAIEVGAVGLGTLIVVIASTTALDVTGVLAATAMAVLGLFVIPSRRRRLKDELRRRIADVRETLMGALTTQYESEVSRGLTEIETAISPYSRFVRSQQQRWSETRVEMGTIEKWLKRQESEIQSL
jgi:small GTP-binding protein